MARWVRDPSYVVKDEGPPKDASSAEAVAADPAAAPLHAPATELAAEPATAPVE